jgi:hypothetical protein
MIGLKKFKNPVRWNGLLKKTVVNYFDQSIDVFLASSNE